MLTKLFEDMRKDIIRIITNSSIKRELFINDDELIKFTVNLTGINNEIVTRVLEAEFLFLKLKGLTKDHEKGSEDKCL